MITPVRNTCPARHQVEANHFMARRVTHCRPSPNKQHRHLNSTNTGQRQCCSTSYPALVIMRILSPLSRFQIQIEAPIRSANARSLDTRRSVSRMRGFCRAGGDRMVNQGFAAWLTRFMVGRVCSRGVPLEVRCSSYDLGVRKSKHCDIAEMADLGKSLCNIFCFLEVRSTPSIPRW